jgi:High potential iron-sulfur protein
MSGRSKRNFLRLALAGLACWPVSPRRSMAQQSLAQGGGKMSKQQAAYQDSPHGIQACATCSLFDEPHGCKVVEGDVSPDGWCKVYAMAD